MRELSMDSIYIGIDPGVNGGYAIVNYAGDFVKAVDHLPTCLNVDSKKQLDLAEFDFILKMKYHIEGYSNIVIVLEKVSSMPNQGVASTFSFGKTYGMLYGWAKCNANTLIEPVPRVWKKYFGLTSDKQLSLDKAKEFYPEVACRLSRKKDADRAEALLLARYGWEMFNK